MITYDYHLTIHRHGNHSHFNLKKAADLPKKNNDSQEDNTNCKPCEHNNSKTIKKIGKNDEGCPCCLASIDLDEVATALNEISSKGGNLETHKHSLGELANFSSTAHWGIFLGISGPLALVGLTAAIRNIKGTLNNQKKLEDVINGLKEDIAECEKDLRSKSSDKTKENLSKVIQRLKAFKETLEYSKFDTKFNLVVPGIINGGASTAVLSSAIVSSPWALPIIALYAGCQTVRNGYDLWKTWNKILPQEAREEVQLNMNVGIRKINQITDSKRKFYAANTLGFATFTAGATITTLSALSVIGAPGLAVGLPLLAVGAVSTGITNNIWTGKFKPRNGDLGIKREELDLNTIKQEIGERREMKKLLKNYKDKHLPNKLSKRLGCSLLSSLPFCNEKGQKLLHKVNKSRVFESKSSDEDRLDLLERAINVKELLKTAGDKKDADKILKKISGLKGVNDAEKKQFGLVSFDKNKPACEQIFESLGDLGIDTIVLDKFIKNAILKTSHNHDKSIKNKEDYFKKLTDSRLFTINDNKVTFDLGALEGNQEMKKAFMNSLEECLLFDYVDKLRYEQYGLNDFYFALDKQNKKKANINNKNCKDYQEKESDSNKINHECRNEHQNLSSTKIDSEYNIGDIAEEERDFKQIKVSPLAFTLTEIDSDYNIGDIAEVIPEFKQVKVLSSPKLLSSIGIAKTQ
jgi:hypothetical protein